MLLSFRQAQASYYYVGTAAPSLGVQCAWIHVPGFTCLPTLPYLRRGPGTDHVHPQECQFLPFNPMLLLGESHRDASVAIPAQWDSSPEMRTVQRR